MGATKSIDIEYVKSNIKKLKDLNSDEYKKLKSKLIEELKTAFIELEYGKLEKTKNYIEELVYYLRIILSE